MNAPVHPLELVQANRRQLLANGYEAIPIFGKRPLCKGWSEGEITDARLAEIEAAYPDHTNTGIRTGLCAAVDIDLTNPAHAMEAKKPIVRVLGNTLVHRVGSKGDLLCYFNPNPIPKITVSGDGKRLIEFLGVGQQFAAYGTHPETGRPYDWPEADLGAEPLQWLLTDLPQVSSDMLRIAATQVADRLRQLGYSDVRVSDAKSIGSRQAQPSAATGAPVTAAMVEAMLRCIPPSCDRGEWLTACAGLINAPVIDPDWDGLDLFIRWSRGDLHGETPDNFMGEDDCEEQWQRDLEKRNAR